MLAYRNFLIFKTSLFNFSGHIRQLIHIIELQPRLSNKAQRLECMQYLQYYITVADRGRLPVLRPQPLCNSRRVSGSGGFHTAPMPAWIRRHGSVGSNYPVPQGSPVAAYLCPVTTSGRLPVPGDHRCPVTRRRPAGECRCRRYKTDAASSVRRQCRAGSGWECLVTSGGGLLVLR